MGGKSGIRLMAQYVIPSLMPHFVMLSLGLLEEEGLDIRPQIAKPGTKWWDYLGPGEVDIVLGGPRVNYNVADAGTSERFVSFAQPLQVFFFFLLGRAPQPDFRWQDLEGKSIVGVTPDTARIFKQYVLRKNRVDPRKVRVITGMSLDEQVTAFRAGIGDYLEHTEPIVDQLVTSGEAHLVLCIGQAAGFVPITAYSTKESFMQRNPEVLGSFSRAVYRAQLWMWSHTPTEIVELVKPWFGALEAEALQRMIERYRALELWTRNPIPDESQYNHLRDIMLSVGALKREIPFSEVANPEFATRAVESLGS